MASPPPFTPDEQAYYAAVFKQVDKDSDGVIPSGECGQWLQSVLMQTPGVNQPDMPNLFGTMWQLATGAPLMNRNAMQPVAPQEWFFMMRGMACIQNGATQAAMLMQQLPKHAGHPLPAFGGVTFQSIFNRDPSGGPAPAPVAPAPAAPPFLQPTSNESSAFSSGGGAAVLAPTSSSSAFSDDAPSNFTSGFEEEWEMSQDEWNEYKMMFRNADTRGNSRLKGSEAAKYMMNYGLEKSQLKEIWDLIDRDSDGWVSAAEFSAGMHIVTKASRGHKLPAKCPPELLIPPNERASKAPSKSLPPLEGNKGPIDLASAFKVEAPAAPAPQQQQQQPGFGGNFPQQGVPQQQDGMPQQGGNAFGQISQQAGQPGMPQQQQPKAFGAPAGQPPAQPSAFGDFRATNAPQQSAPAQQPVQQPQGPNPMDALIQQKQNFQAEITAIQADCEAKGDVDPQKLADLKKEVSDLKEARDRLRNATGMSIKVDAEIDHTEEILKGLREEVEALRGNFGKFEVQLCEREALLTNKKKELHATRNEISNLRKGIADMQQNHQSKMMAQQQQMEQMQMEHQQAATEQQQLQQQMQQLNVQQQAEAQQAQQQPKMTMPAPTPAQPQLDMDMGMGMPAQPQMDMGMGMPAQQAAGPLVEDSLDPFAAPAAQQKPAEPVVDPFAAPAPAVDLDFGAPVIESVPEPVVQQPVAQHEQPAAPVEEMLQLEPPPAAPAAQAAPAGQAAAPAKGPPDSLTGVPEPEVYPVVLSHQHYTSAVHGVYGAYCAFFEDIRIRNGWQEIPFTKEDLAPIFRVCAEICSVLRARLDVKRIGISLRKLDGQAPEFLWTLKKNPNPQLPGQEKSYVRDCICGIVNHTMMDGNGYVEGIDEEITTNFIKVHPWVAQSGLFPK